MSEVGGDAPRPAAVVRGGACVGLIVGWLYDVRVLQQLGEPPLQRRSVDAAVEAEASLHDGVVLGVGDEEVGDGGEVELS